MRNKIVFLLFVVFVILLTGCKATTKIMYCDTPYTNEYNNFGDMEKDIDKFIEENGQTKPFLLFESITSECYLEGICKFYNKSDITYIESEKRSKATNLYNMRTILRTNYNGSSYKTIELYASFDITDVNNIYYESDASKLTFEVEKAKSPAFAYEGKPILSTYLVEEEKSVFLEYLKQELIDCGYVKQKGE